MTITRLQKAIENAEAKSPEELANSATIDTMMGFSPIETVVRDVVGGDNKLFRAGKMI